MNIENKYSLPTRVVTLSVGITTSEEDATDHEELIKRADLALYKAKECGRNQVQFFKNFFIS